MTGNLKLAVRGAGVALVPLYLAKSDLEEGTLVRVLPDWTSPGLPVTLVSPLASSSSARLKITADLLAANLERELKP